LNRLLLTRRDRRKGVGDNLPKGLGIVPGTFSHRATEHVATKLNALAQSPVSDHELGKGAQVLGCYHWPGSELKYRSWLQHLAAHLRVAAAGNPFKAGGSAAT
jgi:hypothetical protein